MTLSTALLRVVQLTFWAALAYAIFCAVMPLQAGAALIPWDKAAHFIAFYVLTALGAAAFPRLRVIWIAIGLCTFGAAIELIQGLKIVARDREFCDWVADTLAITAALAPIVLIAWRRRFNGRSG